MIYQYEPLMTKEYARRVKEQIESGWIGSGDQVFYFEKKLCELTGRKYAIATTSGTVALFLSLLAMTKNRKNVKVLFPSYTFIAGANVIKYLDLEIVLCEVNYDTMCMDINEVEKFLIKYKYDEKIVMFVEHNGYLGKDVKEVREMCTKYNTLMLEDSAQSVGLDGAGKYGDISIFSFSTPKMITTGQGGAILTDNEEYYDSCCNMKDQGGNWRETKIHKEIGLNFKFNDILACLGLSQLNDLENIKKEKKRIFDEYRKYIKLFDFGQEITAMAALIHDKEFYRFANSKTQTFCEISKLYHPITDHLQFKNLGNFPVAQKIYDTVIYLPSSMFLQEEQIKNVYEILTEMDWKKYERME